MHAVPNSVKKKPKQCVEPLTAVAQRLYVLGHPGLQNYRQAPVYVYKSAAALTQF